MAIASLISPASPLSVLSFILTIRQVYPSPVRPPAPSLGFVQRPEYE
jgi:hypothetical protein